MSSERFNHDWWNQALDAIEGKEGVKFPPVNRDGFPELGCYRTRDGRGGPWVPVYIYLAEGAERPAMAYGFEQRLDVATKQVWPWCATSECVISGELYEETIRLGRWPEPEAPAAIQENSTTRTDENSERGVGDNSSCVEMDPLVLLRDALDEIVNKLARTYGSNGFGKKLLTKADADRCEDDRKGLLAAVKVLVEQRDRINAPAQKIIDDNIELVAPSITAAKLLAGNLKAAADAWLAAEQKRLNEQAAEKGAAVAPEKVMIGTKTEGARRRSVKAPPATARIVNLAEAAAYLAGINHPDLRELVQKVANRLANTKAKMPGCVMSWEEPKQTIASEAKETEPA